MRSNRPLSALAAAAFGVSLLAAQEPPASKPGSAATAERSTAQVETALEPAPPPPPTRLELPADKPALVRDGKISASATAHFVITAPPADRMIEIRIRSADPTASLSIFRGESQLPEPGTTRDDQAVGWISSTGPSDDLRIVVCSTRPAESAFQLLVRLHPPEAPEGGAEPES